MSFITQYFPWVGGLSLTAVLLLATFAPSTLKFAFTIAAEFLTPVAKKVGEKFAAYLDAVLEGAADCLDNWKSILFVATVAGFSGWYFHTSTERCFDMVRKDWKLTPRTNVTKVVKEEDPLTTFFRNFGLR
ncbi:hypothetical protein [Hyphomicrobium sp. ghe19]|uniref:hypothetical protein n=1 Tax=Hyphomicrobium sp. ghe19 TaxID=2682968 RepID=UPI0013675FBA|nr:hypothetical protein HYPP_02624 [Hyphomicrobium sp. ghe19]